MKEKVYEYQRSVTNQVEVYCSELMSKKEQLEECQTKLHKLMRDSHVTQRIKQKGQMTQEIEKHFSEEEMDSCISLPAPYLIVPKGKYKSI